MVHDRSNIFPSALQQRSDFQQIVYREPKRYEEAARKHPDDRNYSDLHALAEYISGVSLFDVLDLSAELIAANITLDSANESGIIARPEESGVLNILMSGSAR